MENHFLVKKAHGEILHIYYMKGNGICVQKTGQAGNIEVLLRNGFYDFDSWYNPEKDEIHIVCQNSEGSITHILWQGGEWKKKELLTGKLKLPYPKHFRILPVEEKLMFFYIIRHDGMLLLVSQWIGEKGVPLVVGFISDENQQFVSSVQEGRPSVIYINSDGQTEQKVLEEKHWQNKSLSLGNEAEIPIGLCRDYRGNDHLLTCQKKKGKIEFFYRLKNKKIWGEKMCVFQTEESPVDTAFLLEENVPVFIFFSRSEVRVFSLKNRIWEENPTKERLAHRLKKPVKVKLLSGRREETLGGFEQGRVELILKKKFLLPKEETLSPNFAEEKGLEEKISELEKNVKMLESKIASIQEFYKKG